MQKLITKYGLAAHLALLAVAPLFLSPNCVLWLSAVAAVWVVMEPSRIGFETLHASRKRSVGAIVRDPVFWFSIVLVAYSAIRFLNGGVAMAYDAELTLWKVTEPMMPILPGSVDSAGYPEFVANVALLIVLQGCRHALGQSARMAFLLISSFLSGLSASILAVQFVSGSQGINDLVVCGMSNPIFRGSVFGAYWIVGTVAMLAAYERRWFMVMPLAFVAVGGNAAGMFLFAPPMVHVPFAGGIVVVFLYAFFYARRRLSKSGEFKFLIAYSMSLVLGGVLVVAALPDKMMAERLVPYLTGKFFADDFLVIRNVLSTISLKVWKDNPWLGTGLGSFPLDLRFAATETDWAIVSSAQRAPLNGYWLLLVERGIVGAAMMAFALGFLLWTFFRRMVKGVRVAIPHPASWMGLLVLIVVLVEAAVDISYSIPGVFVVVAATLAISASSFPKEIHHG